MTAKPAIRCAIYTRKSSEEGLDQAFNSLDAQYEACAAYVASQRHEGWKLVTERYDDGGLSGGTLERPALQRLLAEVDARRVSLIIVYKIDRLTRSLADFVRLVDRLDAKGCSFVSVTQAFNTSTSMGRLTLNVLLSFAQFEREVTAERIRDKIAASKKKGLWMGGSLPLGYDRHPDPQRRELVVNRSEADVVVTLFDLYDQAPNLRTVEGRADELGLRSKVTHPASGRSTGGKAFSRGQLHYLLTNKTYLGRIRHHEKDYPGLHPALIDQDLWDRVQQKLQSSGARPRGRSVVASPSRCLLGKLQDDTGDLLTPSHTERRGRRYSYYISHRLIRGAAHSSAWRLSAPALEAALRGIVIGHLRQLAVHHAVLARPDAVDATRLRYGLQKLCLRMEAEPDLIASFLKRAVLHRDRITGHLDAQALAKAFGLDAEDIASETTQFDHAITLRRRGVETRIVAGDFARTVDPVLVRVLAEARLWAKALQSGTSLTDLAAQSGHSEPYLRMRLPLAFLSPKLQTAILDGSQPTDLSVARLIASDIPLDWAEQDCLFT